jgi:hypothetical protein
MSVFIKARVRKGKATNTVDLVVNKAPDSCPICHKNILPERKYGWLEDEILQLVFQCPNNACKRLFIAYYSENEVVEGSEIRIVYFFRGSAPQIYEKKSFPKEITDISKNFEIIYNEAFEAEHRELYNVCGVGYKKALETLIKDYLMKDKRDKSEIIALAEMTLSDCIDQSIHSREIQDCARSTEWFSKDGAEYIRAWKKKDLENLKDLIQLTMNWIQNELLSEKIKKDFPESKSKSKIRM